MATPPDPLAISELRVSGYKSIAAEQRVKFANLTVLAGANSSGKSSMLQPLLLLKQTLDASYDPGALLLNGPEVRYTSAQQLLSFTREKQLDAFEVTVVASNGSGVTICFKHDPGAAFALEYMETIDRSGRARLALSMSQEEIRAALPNSLTDTVLSLARALGGAGDFVLRRDRCFLEVSLRSRVKKGEFTFGVELGSHQIIASLLRDMIHLPGLRGNPERLYPVTAVEPRFPGTFEKYTASVIADWQRNGRPGAAKLKSLARWINFLGLSSRVQALHINDTQVELLVSRSRGSRGMVNIADVGVGVSQTLPVLVALLVARPGQFVYVEQPEIHLHPRAQVALADILGEAARRGVRVVVETHSSLLLLGIQTLIAEKKLPAADVKLHWFRQGRGGQTVVRSATPDAVGAVGPWPEDFGEVNLQAEGRYISAAESALT